MLEYHSYNSFIRKTQEFKLSLKYWSTIFLGENTAHYGNDYIDYYSRYFQDSQES